MSKLDNSNFHFEYTFLDKTLKKLEKLGLKKASQMDDTPVKTKSKKTRNAAHFNNRG